MQSFIERLASRLSTVSEDSKNKSGFTGGVVIGLSLGLVWAPCVGPILASVIALAATSQVNLQTFFITLAYSLGSGIPMLAIMYGGRNLLLKLPILTKNTARIQKVFGVLMILTALMIFFNIDRAFQAYILEKFPQYGTGLTRIEDNSIVKNQLATLKTSTTPNPTFQGYTKWLNSKPLTLEELRGKVVLVDFWTYTCINCVRTLPYVTSWYEKYKDKGFVVIGVHTPEFAFEKKSENVLTAMKDFHINYPVVQDNDYNIWNSYQNQYWPAEYLIDAQGNLRDTHFGEGNYAESEKKIQALLKEAGEKISPGVVNLSDATPLSAMTPESYLGFNRLERITNLVTTTGQQLFDTDPNIPENGISFGGTWDIQPEESVAKRDAELSIHFNADQVYLVMTPTSSSDQVQVYLDGKIVPSSLAGKDVVNGTIKLDAARLYSLINLHGNNGNHILKLIFKTSGTSVFAFTFG